MKKTKLRILTGLIFLFVLTIMACKSTPPAAPVVESAPVAETAPVAKPAEPVPEPVVAVKKPIDDALTSLRDEMERVRTECIKYKLDTYKAVEWKEAEAVRATGLESYGKDYDKAESSFKDAISKYLAIQIDSFNQIVPELEQAIIKAREDAIAAGAREYYPEQFVMADAAVEEALAIYKTEDRAGAYEAGQKALMRFQTLLKGMQAISLKQTIDLNGFEQYALEDAALAVVKYEEATLAYGVADAAALEAAMECVFLAEKVVNAGYRVWAESMLVKAKDIRILCDSIKAEKSMKEPYASAVAKYNQALSYGQNDQWENSYNAYSEATIAFTDIYQEVTLKRNMADVAIAEAKRRQEESTELAIKADLLAPLPDNAEGFSDEPVMIDDTLSGEGTK